MAYSVVKGKASTEETDLAAIARKVQAGIPLSPGEKQRYDANLAEAAARSGGTAGAQNGPAGANPLDAIANAAQFAFDPGGHLPVASTIQQVGTSGAGAGTGGASGIVKNSSGSSGGGAVGDPIQQILDEARRNQTQNNAYIDNTLQPRVDAWNQGIGATLGSQRASDDFLAQNYGGMFAQQSGNAAKYNQSDLDSLANYGTAVNTANTADQNTLGFLAGTYSGMSQLSPTQIRSNLEAVTATLNTAGLTQAQYQTAALTKAALERAESNPDDVNAQKDALGLMTQMSEGSLDIQNGGNTPEAKAAQLEALSRYGSLSASPEVTGQERLIYETARTEQERQEKASRDALMQGYRLQGMGGSEMEFGNILMSGQQNSQNRLLADLGAQSNAVDRQMEALAGYGTLSSSMMQQGNDVASSNAANRLQATGMRGDMASTIRGQGDTMNMFNTDQANQNEQFNAGQANQNAQFNANAYNSNEQFNSAQANQVGMFNAGQANQTSQFNASAQNQTNQYNQTQNMIQSQFEDNYRAGQQTDAWNRATGLSNASFGVNDAGVQRAGSLNTATNATNTGNYARDADTINVWGQGATNIHNAQTGTNNQQLAALQGGRATDLAVSGQRIGTSQQGSLGVQDALSKAAGEKAAEDAIASINSGGSSSGGLSWLTNGFKSA